MIAFWTESPVPMVKLDGKDGSHISTELQLWLLLP